MSELQRIHAAGLEYIGAGQGAAVCGDLLLTADGLELLAGGVRSGRVRVVLACDPGVQSGYVLAGSVDGVVVPIASWVIGHRTTGRKGDTTRAPQMLDHDSVITVAFELCDGWLPCPATLVCEDWFAGPNPNTARDIARQFYFCEAAAERRSLTFRAVHHGTWKKTYIGRGNMRSVDAIAAYTARGFAAHPEVTRWAGKAPHVADDSAALGIAYWWLESEST